MPPGGELQGRGPFSSTWRSNHNLEPGTISPNDLAKIISERITGTVPFQTPLVQSITKEQPVGYPQKKSYGGPWGERKEDFTQASQPVFIPVLSAG